MAEFKTIHTTYGLTAMAQAEATGVPSLLRRMSDLGIAHDKLNVNGGSLAAGHPFAATGGRILANLATMIDRRGGGRGLISICAAGGQGVVAVVEK